MFKKEKYSQCLITGRPNLAGEVRAGFVKEVTFESKPEGGDKLIMKGGGWGRGERERRGGERRKEERGGRERRETV